MATNDEKLKANILNGLEIDLNEYFGTIKNIQDKFSRLNFDSIVGNILESKEEYNSICDILRIILKWKNLSYVTTFYQELLALFLVGAAKY